MEYQQTVFGSYAESLARAIVLDRGSIQEEQDESIVFAPLEVQNSTQEQVSAPEICKCK